ncbi:pyridoxal-dependent decarboxylase, exosortase A system-associated [Nitrosomonas sp.]|uniref:pyridoxal-dependent decarboxylase, exosortase A system-associated n=1 Tax=Nitrosomonas sp. TaxID=42353 RepID=UPI00272F0411|nr:pyridoxal-dependent decarboxylase, exosortase A system-associated [Nitrosomonas sp.]MDP1787491.1 pyridoxal-dependent decarboxylase, exosortase A system-associated [Nitrosomonas sp.]
MNNSPPEHAPLVQFPVLDDCLQIGGIALTRLVQQVGSTPFYAYDRQKITERVALLRQHLPAGILLHYAMKANPMPAVVQHLAGLVDGVDVASAGEMKTALDTTLSPEKISFAGPGKKEHELRSAIAAGVVLNLESEQEMELVAQLGEYLGIIPNVAIRVNPNFELRSSGMKMGGGPKPFGVDAERVPDMLIRLSLLGLNFVGFHIFSGSQNLNATAIQEMHTKTFQLGIRLAEHAPSPVRLFNIGGGFGVPYFPGDQTLNIAAIGENLQHLMPEVKRQFPDVRIAIELGRYMVAEAGVYVCRVLERKVSRGQTFLVTDGGLHHHLAASGNFGQVIRKNYPVIIGNKVRGADREIVSVVGPLCTPLDLLADQMQMAKASVDDLVVILQSGAYGLTASPTAFLSHPIPIEVLV